MQFVQVTFAARLGGLLVRLTMFERLRLPVVPSILLRVWVMQFVFPSLRQTTSRAVG